MWCIYDTLFTVSSACWQIGYMVMQLNIANIWNNSVTATKYIEYGHITLSIMCVLVYNEQTNYLCMYKRLLTNRIHGKAAEL